MVGRPKEFTDAERAAQGNPGNRQLPASLPADVIFPDAITYVPEPPEWLKGKRDSDLGAAAILAWKTLAPILVDAKQLRDGDQISLARYCRFVAEWVECTNDIDDRGMIVSEEGGGEHRNPSLLARAQIEKDIQSLEKSLGLTPTSRVSLQEKLMAALRDLPLVGNQANRGKTSGPVGFLNSPDEE